jgi:hypothetical protein
MACQFELRRSWTIFDIRPPRKEELAVAPGVNSRHSDRHGQDLITAVS